VVRLAHGIDLATTALFALSTVVQINDPDPLRWMALYGAAGAITAVSIRRRVAPAIMALVGAVAAAWGVHVVSGGPLAGSYAHMFDAWEMRSVDIEQAREASGLFIVAAWMAVLGVRAIRVPAAGAR
jgi:hypothetical protein